MKLKVITLSLAIVALAACKQKNEKNHEGHHGDSPAAQTPAVENTPTTNEKKGVFFVNIKDGDMVKSPVIVQMGINGMEVEPAGVKNEGKGHHHIIIDGAEIETGRPVAKNATHIHYGQGQTSDTLELTPGPHKLTLQFADGLHQSYGPEWSNTITIVVEK
jgi:hypothetical protein